VIEVKDNESGKKVILRTNECISNHKLNPFDVMFTSKLTKTYALDLHSILNFIFSALDVAFDS
jgi:hypothetical protein